MPAARRLKAVMRMEGDCIARRCRVRASPGDCWWALKDLNLRPTDYESAALTAELRARSFNCNNLSGFSQVRLFRCSENCRESRAAGRLRFGFRFRRLVLVRVELFEPLKGPLHALRCRVHVPLRYCNAAVSGNPHDREGVRPCLAQPGQHGVPQRMYHEVRGEL